MERKRRILDELLWFHCSDTATTKSTREKNNNTAKGRCPVCLKGNKTLELKEEEADIFLKRDGGVLFMPSYNGRDHEGWSRVVCCRGCRPLVIETLTESPKEREKVKQRAEQTVRRALASVPAELSKIVCDFVAEDHFSHKCHEMIQ